ncbi:PqiC family protein [Tropicimonas sp.]|uniref:PqiC family protein n=1 Tax=Tropicimonas sp. TaxID=2067044 RepID=UPI003A88BF1A
MRLLFSALVSTLVLAGCSGAPVRYATPPVAAGERIGISVSQIEVREVELPSYARTEEIWIEGEDGALKADSSVLWADEPARGVTQELVRNLAGLTGARIAAEPWPFEDLPQTRLFVRVDEMVAGADGRFRLSGQYFVARVSAGRDGAGSFSVSAPIAPDSGKPGIAAARAAAVRDLARTIAAQGL